MQTFTCPTCGKEWPENYCPQCAATIDRVLVPKPSSTPKQETETPTSIPAPSHPLTAGRVFRRALIWACAVQLAFYFLFRLQGTDKATSSLNTFGSAYDSFYYPGVAAMWVLASPFVKDGLPLWAFGLVFGPLIGLVAYALVFACGTMIWFKIRRRGA